MRCLLCGGGTYSCSFHLEMHPLCSANSSNRLVIWIVRCQRFGDHPWGSWMVV